MKKTFTRLLFFASLLLCGKAFSQSEATHFSPSINPPIPVQLSAQNTISVSSIEGLSGTVKSVALTFSNSGKVQKTFGCIVKDKSGKIIYSVSGLVLNPGESIGIADYKYSFNLPEGVKSSELKTELTF
ncbi:hypothetical protein BH09BAC5_BH09BAC5_18210 [soil metagenome]